MIELIATIFSYDVPFHIPIPIEYVPFVVLIIMGVIIGGYLLLRLLGVALEKLLETGVGNIILGVILIIAGIVLGSFFPIYFPIILFLVFIGIIPLVMGIYDVIATRLRIEDLMKTGVRRIIAGILIIVLAFGFLIDSIYYLHWDITLIMIALVIIGIIPLLIGIYNITVKRSRQEKTMVNEQPSTPQISPTEQRLQNAALELKLMEEQRERMKRLRGVKKGISGNVQMICAGVILISLGIVFGFSFPLQIFLVIIGIILIAIGIIRILVKRSRI